MYTSGFEDCIHRHRTSKIGEHPAIRRIRSEAKSFLNSSKFKDCYYGILLYYIRKILDEADKIIAKTFLCGVFWDASHSTLPTLHYHKLVGLFVCYVSETIYFVFP